MKHYGTLRLAGNMIWSSGITEQRNVARSQTGGKGGASASQTAVSYAYTASFAIVFAEGPAEDVLRLWADGKLIYDKTGASPRWRSAVCAFACIPATKPSCRIR